MTEAAVKKKAIIKVETLKGFILKLRKIKGYKASGVLAYTGKILARDSVDPKIDLDVVGSTFNDILQESHEASENVGLEACLEIAINTPKGVIVIRCSGVDAPVHFHLMVVMDSDENLGRVKIELDRFIELVMEEISRS